MESHYNYIDIANDLSGSMAKNRFRNEMLWGLKKIYELHKSKGNYVVVFDYACDVEVHINESYEFYQLKTQADNEGYDINKSLRKKNGKSVLGKLYILKYDSKDNECNQVSVSLVSNAPLVAGDKSYNLFEKIKLQDLETVVVDNIKTKLKSELGKNEVTLENAYFIRTGLDLFEPHKTLIGETTLFFEEIYGTEPKKAASLYRVLSNEVSNKACYELEISDYDELVAKKGITRVYIEGILDKYVENTDIAVEKTRNFIYEISKNNFKKRLQLLKSLSSIVTGLSCDKWLQNLEDKMKYHVIDALDELPDDEQDIVNSLISEFCGQLEVDYTITDLEVLSILVLKKIEEGLNE